MAVRIRLKRVGMPKQPHFRLVAIEGSRARDGKELEVLGTYDPREKENKIQVKAERLKHWLSVGAQPSETVRSLLLRNQIVFKHESASPPV